MHITRQAGTATSYSLAGLAIEVRCENSVVADLVDERLGTLRVDAEPTDDMSGAEIVIDIRGPGADPGWPGPPTGTPRSVYDAPAGTIDYFDESGELYVFYERRVALRCRPADGRIDLAIVTEKPDDVVLAVHPLLTIGLLETIKRFRRFPLHAGALSRRGRGILLPGSSGAGKSTTTVALVRGGFDFLADDTVFLTAPGEVADIWVHGFPDQVDVTENTAAMFPELAHLVGRPLPLGRDKHGFRVEDVFGVRPVTRCRPVALMFPRVVAGRASHTEPLSPAVALRQLVPNVLLTDPGASQAHLDMLGRLVRTVPSYVLCAGSDFDAVVSSVSDLVTEHAA